MNNEWLNWCSHLKKKTFLTPDFRKTSVNTEYFFVLPGAWMKTNAFVRFFAHPNLSFASPILAVHADFAGLD